MRDEVEFVNWTLGRLEDQSKAKCPPFQGLLILSPKEAAVPASYFYTSCVKQAAMGVVGEDGGAAAAAAAAAQSASTAAAAACSSGVVSE